MGLRVAVLVFVALSAQAQSILLAEPGQAPVATDWPDAETPIPVGSLVKPFLALAFASEHGGDFPVIDCQGVQQCWFAAGHEELALEAALAHSCNAYFRRLAQTTPFHRLESTLRQYSLPPPPASHDAWIGLGRDWLIPPSDLLAAYRELLARRADPIVARILRGLELSARSGTASAVGRTLPAPALAKTGTAPSSTRAWGGDGFAFVAYPAASPRYTMLLRAKGQTGRRAAEAAAQALQQLVQPPRTPR